MLERAERVRRTQFRQRVEVERAKRLAELAAAYTQIGEGFPTAVKPKGPHVDHAGIPRGFCPQCNECPGFQLPATPHAPALLRVCVHCGCEASCHDEMRTEAQRQQERNDDILRQPLKT